MFKWAGRTLAACVVLAAVPASAQSNLSGVWNNLGILNEDWPDRLPGPELGDYAGLPVNDAVRARADAWDASLITLPEYQCRVHPSDYVSELRGPAHLGGTRLGVAAAHRDPHASFRVGHRAHDLDGRPPASARVRPAHRDGLLHRQMGRRHPRRDDDASERGLDAAQRPDAERLGDGDRTLHPSRRHADAGDFGRRSRSTTPSRSCARATTNTK